MLIQHRLSALIGDKVKVQNHRTKNQTWEEGTVKLINIDIDAEGRTKVFYDILLDRTSTSGGRSTPIWIKVTDGQILRPVSIHFTDFKITDSIDLAIVHNLSIGYNNRKLLVLANNSIRQTNENICYLPDIGITIRIVDSNQINLYSKTNKKVKYLKIEEYHEGMYVEFETV